jgi:UDP-glucuronate decarboxylase
MHPNDGRVVSNFITQALRGDDITLFGAGTQTRAFCYVSDLIDGVRRMMDSGADVVGPINLGNPHEISVLALAETVLRLTHSTSRIVFRPLPQDDPMQRCPDISRARTMLDWVPSVALEEGLRQTIEYFNDLMATSQREMA